MVGDLSLGYLVDTTMQRGNRVPISLFIATHSVNAQMWELLPPKKSVELPEDLTIVCGFCFLHSFSLSVFACESCSQQSLQTGIQVSACVRFLPLMYIPFHFVGLMFTFSIKREIRKFHLVLVQ